MSARRRATGLTMTACVAVMLGSAPRAADQTASELAQALQRRYDAIRDFSADFVHTYQGGVLRKQLAERGKVLIKKPGKMHWDYTAPEPKQFVSDGLKIYSYIPEDKQVFVGSVPREDEATTPTLFLTGKGNLTRDFTASFAEVPAGVPPASRALKLVPRARERDYDWLILALDPTTLAIRGLVTVDAQGGTSSFAFTNLKENVGLSDSAFVFRVPRGVDVVTDTSR